MDNPVRRLRTALGWSQQRLANYLEMSIMSVRNYEKGAQAAPPRVVDKLRILAAESGLIDVEPRLSSDEGQSFDVPHPDALTPDATLDDDLLDRDPAFSSRHLGPNAEWHDLLNAVLDSGSSDAITAVQNDLLVLARYVRLRKGWRSRRATTKGIRQQAPAS